MRLHNPLLKFDGHVLSGRWSAWLQLKPGTQGAIGPEEQSGRPQAGFVDLCRRKDLAGMQDVAIAEATQRSDNA